MIPAGEASDFHPRGVSAGLHGPLIRVRSHTGVEWVGQFFSGPGELSGLFCGPSPNHLCVVAGGLGYLVEVTQPLSFEIVRARPIKELRRVPGASILVFVDYTNVVAYSPEGLIWTVENLADDGLTIDDITSKRLTVRAIGDELSPDRAHLIDVRTGAVHLRSC